MQGTSIRAHTVRWTLALASASTLALPGCYGMHNDQSTMGGLSLADSSNDDDDDDDVEETTDTDGTTGEDSADAGDPSGDPDASESDGETSTTGASPICGNGVQEGDEACDDGNGDNTDDCLNTCTLASCGDGHVRAGVEDCDDGDNDDTDDCTSACVEASCGDGFVREGVEACDDGNADNTDDCLNTCVKATCGDGFLNTNSGEVCDDGVNDSGYGSCKFDCSQKMAHCGDKLVQKEHGEMCDGDSPSVEVPCTSDCTFDFSDVKQLYCFGSCSWVWPNGCDQGDADLFCRLLTGNPDSVATSYDVVEALDTSGLACADSDVLIYDPMFPPKPGDPAEEARIDLGGPLEAYGVDLEQIFYIELSVAATHGPNSVILPPNCTNP